MNTVTEQKRPRGRPRKVVDELVEKRPRGRPVKPIDEEKLIENAIKHYNNVRKACKKYYDSHKEEISIKGKLRRGQKESISSPTELEN